MYLNWSQELTNHIPRELAVKVSSSHQKETPWLFNEDCDLDIFLIVMAQSSFLLILLITSTPVTAGSL